ncbi:MAG: single-stranded-DNA-specific exonuclease RecJ [Phycisphaerales bacterium]
MTTAATAAASQSSLSWPIRGWNKRWVPAGPFATAGLITERVLTARGHTDPSAIANFLEPKLTDLHDPSLIPDLDRAAARLLDALKAREPIAIYGDYDVDGITSTAILYHTLKALGPDADIRTYVPHRLDEGYGLNVEAINQLAAAGAKVIVSVDCGVTAHAPALAAKTAGVDLIITDHHNPPARLEDLPQAYAVVHPRRPDSTYPFDHLSGAGVAYKLAWRLATLDFGSGKASPALRTLLVDLLAFAALGSIADVVPLLGENRVIARFGLARIKDTPLIGLRALVDAARLTGDKVSAWDVGFRLGPRLNACGRMAHAKDAVELFTTADESRAAAIATDLEARNSERRAVEQKILETAIARVEAEGLARDDRRAIVLADAAWHKGVVGIVCSRLVDRYCRPTILLQIEGDSAHGSGRSIDCYNLHAGLVATAEHLDRFGGHDMAAGMGIRVDRLPAFIDAFTAHANQHITLDQLVHNLRVDAVTSLGELTPRAVQSLESLAPFGRSNPGVHVLLPGLTIQNTPTPLGKGGEHLALTVRHAGDSHAMKLVAWRWGAHRSKLAAGVRLHAVVRPQISTYGGRTTVEPELLDLAILE